MVEAKGSLTDDDKAGDLAAQRKAFNDRKLTTQTKHTPEDIVALYAGNN
ncbi:hypothetical protein ALQ74_103372 [Pseudomonas savastanoi pv. glycinea]|uniref:Uncharacterized protein n=2 Tax=Pseudomonas savastanoi TaxID=29438 RepID=A0A3M3FLG5_PSESG|nr:hypothetical protein ALQ74_103372 [Pseudomonas savastanoi pv. glycinea]RMQ53972.1 hypothetical protein ALQ02_102841 [Pseudomonas savastanoi pv. phaseolicola]RMV75581.1 hypothetical protein ALP07_103840 [Pseudomonas savastanoi pv. glycinea]